MVLLRVWRHPLSAGIGLAVILIVLLWPAVPLRGLGIWLQTLTGYFPTNLLYPIFALLLGSYAALFSYDKWVARCCRVTGKGTASASLGGVILGACPACIPALGFFLPLSATVAIGFYSWIILLAAIGLITFSVWRAGGFQKEPDQARP